jgi:hypothetical protein
MFPREHEFTALVMDCGLGRYLAAISLRGESNNLESRIERVSGMYFLEKLMGTLQTFHNHLPRQEVILCKAEAQKIFHIPCSRLVESTPYYLHRFDLIHLQ